MLKMVNISQLNKHFKSATLMYITNSDMGQAGRKL